MPFLIIKKSGRRGFYEWSTCGRRAVDERLMSGRRLVVHICGASLVFRTFEQTRFWPHVYVGVYISPPPRHFGSTTFQFFPVCHYLRASCIRHALVFPNPPAVLATGKVFHRVNDTEDRLLTQTVNECRTSCNQNATGAVGGN